MRHLNYQLKHHRIEGEGQEAVEQEVEEEAVLQLLAQTHGHVQDLLLHLLRKKVGID